MAAFAGKLLLVLGMCLAERASATNFGITEPFPDNIYPIEGTEAQVTCVAFDSDGVKTPERIQFMRKDQFARYSTITTTDNIYFTNMTEVYTDQDGKKLKKLFVTMHIKNVTQAEDSQFGPLGRYECHAFAVGDSVERKHGFSVNVIRKSEIPTVSVSKVGILSHGENVIISCNLTEGTTGASGTGLKRISLYKNNKLVQSVRNPDPKNQQDSLGPLVLTNVGVRDGGTYMCRLEVLLRNVKLFNVSDSTMIRIRVRFPIKKSYIAAFIGDNVTLVCSAQGFPLNVTWKKNQPGPPAVIKSSGRFILQGQCPYCQSSLVIQNVILEDSGSYSCNALGNPGQQVFLVEVSSATTTVNRQPSTAVNRGFSLHDSYILSILVDFVATIIIVHGNIKQG